MGEINRENQWPVALLVFILFTLVLEGKTVTCSKILLHVFSYLLVCLFHLSCRVFFARVIPVKLGKQKQKQEERNN